MQLINDWQQKRRCRGRVSDDQFADETIHCVSICGNIRSKYQWKFGADRRSKADCKNTTWIYWNLTSAKWLTKLTFT